MTKIFISYSRKDTDFARKLAGDLEKAGYDVWWDITDIQGGDTWVNSIPDAIETSQYMLVVLSPDSVTSPWVQKEYTQALSLRKSIIPLMLEATRIPFALNTIQAIDFTKGHYEDNYKILLKTIGYTGEAPAVTTFINKRLQQIPALRKYAFPIGLVAVLIVALIVYLLTGPGDGPPPLTSTPTVASSPTITATPEPATATHTATDSPTPTSTPARPTATFTPTLPQAFSLPICIYVIDSNANVREGPGTSYVIIGKIDTNGSKCPSFSARIVNVEREVWFQFAHDQHPEFQPYADQWISGSSLAAFDLPRPLPLPICVSDPAGVVSVRILPSLSEEPLGDRLTADGTHCPFFTTRRETGEGIWYQFSPNQRGNEDFQQYAGGWIHEDSLVVRTFNLPVITLTPAPAPTATFTITPTFTQTKTSTPSNTPTLTPTSTAVDTDTPVPTNTPTP